MWSGISSSPQSRKTHKKLTIIRHLLLKTFKELASQHQRQSPISSPKLKTNEPSQSQGVSEVIKQLKKGYIMTKHSDNTVSKTKFVYLSMNERFLCWKSVDKQDEKRIQISTISKIVRDPYNYLKKSSKIKEPDNCLAIVAEERTLVLQALDWEQSHLFEADIERAIKYCRKMSLNYPYLND